MLPSNDLLPVAPMEPIATTADQVQLPPTTTDEASLPGHSGMLGNDNGASLLNNPLLTGSTQQQQHTPSPQYDPMDPMASFDLQMRMRQVCLSS